VGFLFLLVWLALLKLTRLEMVEEGVDSLFAVALFDKGFYVLKGII
jgi:hypothetical protein